MSSSARTAGKSQDLLNHSTDWGVAVSEPSAQKTTLSRTLFVASIAIFFIASMVAIPVMVGLLLFPAASGLGKEALIVLGCIGIAVFFQAQSKKGPRNSLQIDYAASEIRLGSEGADGSFVRHRVCKFRQIDKVSVDSRDPEYPAICLHMNDEVLTVRFKNANPRSLDLLAAKISAAKESARKAPIRSRIQSAFLGIDASYREVGQRVKSRVISRAV